MIINATTQRVFERLCEAIGQPDLPSDPRFTPRTNLLENHEAIHAIVGEWVEAQTLEECLGVLEEFGIPATKVYATSDIVADPHYAAREQVITMQTETYGPLLQPGIAPRLTDTPGKVPGRAPNLGEHNREIFVGMLGVSEADFERFEAAGVI